MSFSHSRRSGHVEQDRAPGAPRIVGCVAVLHRSPTAASSARRAATTLPNRPGPDGIERNETGSNLSRERASSRIYRRYRQFDSRRLHFNFTQLTQISARCHHSATRGAQNGGEP